MRAHEFITEQSLSADVARALPGTYTMPELPNSDFYAQYRFGVALAGAKGAAQRAKDDVTPYAKETAWGENMIVSSYMDPTVGQDIDYALKEIGKRGKRQISTPDSEESTDTVKVSPVKAFKGFK
jgi:hypothetical protein